MADADYLQLKIKRGETFSQRFQWLESDGVTPVDITGFVLTADARTSVNSTGVLFSLTCAALAETGDIDAAHGWFELSATSTVTGAIPSTAEAITDTDTYYYDVRANMGSSIEYPIEGDIEVTGAVTLA